MLRRQTSAFLLAWYQQVVLHYIYTYLERNSSPQNILSRKERSAWGRGDQNPGEIMPTHSHLMTDFFLFLVLIVFGKVCHQLLVCEIGRQEKKKTCYCEITRMAYNLNPTQHTTADKLKKKNTLDLEGTPVPVCNIVGYSSSTQEKRGSAAGGGAREHYFLR